MRKITTILKIMLLIACVGASAGAYGQTNPTAQTIPYSQDFSGLAHTSTTYPAGIQGWTIGTAASTAFRTNAPTADATLTASSSATENSGGVHNYNGKIGFLQSGSTDPAIALAIVTTGKSNIVVTYDVMTIRNPHEVSSNTRINEFSLQYRIGTTGTFNTLYGAEYQNNTTTQTGSGVTTPQNLQTMSVMLPTSCNNQPVVQIRWVARDLSGGGSRPSFAIDNLNIAEQSPASYTNYYSKSSGNLNDVSTWGTNTDGSGTNPTNFTTNYQIFNIVNNATPTIGAAWTVSGLGSMVIVGNGTDATTFTIPSTFAANAVIDVAANATLKMENTTLPSLSNLAAGTTLEFGGATLTIPDRNYTSNLIISGSGNKTWTLGASPRVIGGNITVIGTSVFRILGGQVTVNGNVTVDEGATIECNNHSALFVAATAGTQTLTLNGTARVTSNSTQTPTTTAGFNRQFAFDAYTFGANSIVSFRNPTTTASTTISVNIDGPVSTPFANVEFYTIQTEATTTCQFLLRQNISVTGSIAFPRIASGQPIIFDMNSFNLKVGKQILNSLGTIGSNVGNSNTGGGTRTYTMSGTTELNGSSAQNTLGGTALPSSFTNLKLNNETGVTFANAITVSGTLTLAGNNNYTNLNNITGYTGLEYGATVAQTTGSEFGSTITNLIINNNNGVALGGSKTINGALTLTAGTLATGANTLTINGTTTGAGFINTGASGTLIYGGTAEQTLSASNLTSGAVNNLIINAGSKLTSSGTIAATNLTINSSDSGTGTFKDNGTLTAGTSTVQQYLINQSWYLTSPVNDGVNTANPVSPTNLSRIQSYIEGDGVGNTWSATGTTMVPYKGYITTVSDNPKTVVFTGKINSGSISIPLTRLATSNVNKNGFNLIGNPYTAYLDWVAVAAANASKMPTSTMWYRTKVSGNWDFTTVNGAGVVTPANASRRIPPMQAFWVRASQVGNSTLDVTDAMVLHDNSTSNRLKAPAAANTELQLIRLQVSNATHTDELVIYTDSAAANTLDWYDAPKMDGDNPDKPEMSSLAGTESLAINAMHTLPLDTDIPLRFVTHKANLFALKMNEATNLPAGITVVLKDNGTEIDISSGNEHIFSSDVTTNANRFSLVFRSPGVVTRVNPEVANQLLVHNIANKQIALRYTENMLNTGKLTIYNAMGQLVQQLHMGNEHTVITVPASGVYLIHLVADGKQMSKRVIVK